MQYDKLELCSQQTVLAFLGFYHGAIDGIWSADTIKAMQAFERDDKFLPAVPTSGLPFKLNCRLPKGMYWDSRLVAHRDLTPEKARALLEKRMPRKTEPAKEVAKVETQPAVEPVVETVQEQPVQEPAKAEKNAQK